jgi:hypothetical protein
MLSTIADIHDFGILVKDPSFNPDKFDTLLSRFQSLDGLIALAIMNHCTTDVFKYLVDKGCNVNKPWLHYEPIYYAIQLERKDLLEMLLTAGADYKHVFHKYMGSRNDPKIIQSLLSKHPGLVDTKNRNGYSALHIAAWHGNIEIVRLLVSYGADIWVLNEYGLTALEYCHKKIFYEGRGYDLSTKDRRGRDQIVRLLEEEERTFILYLGYVGFTVIGRKQEIKFNDDNTRMKEVLQWVWTKSNDDNTRMKEVLQWVWTKSNDDIFTELRSYLV